jgi:hypothetical protein
MRVCILCEEEKVSQIREEKKNEKLLTIPCSETGELPATHRFCCIAMSEERATEMVAKAKLTTIEISGPKEFLEKWNLKIIK